MAELQITWVNKNPKDDTHHGITHLGGPGWRGTRGEVLAAMEAGAIYYAMVGEKKAEIRIMTERNGAKYLRMFADGYWNDGLLALPACKD